MSGDKGHNHIPITTWVMNKLITDPAEQLPKPLSLTYFVVASPLIGIGALGGYAADKTHDYLVKPVVGTAGYIKELIVGQEIKTLKLEPATDTGTEPERYTPKEDPLRDASGNNHEGPEPYALPQSANRDGPYAVPGPDTRDRDQDTRQEDAPRVQGGSDTTQTTTPSEGGGE